MKKYLVILIVLCSSLSSNAQVIYNPDLSGKNFGGLRLYNNDSTFSCNMRFRMQNRAAFTFDDEYKYASSEFLVRRLRLRFNGFVGSKKFNYSIQLCFSRGDMDWDITKFPNVIRDAMITYKATKKFSIGIGQTKLPGNRERVISSAEIQFADRSNANGKFTIDRDFGIQGAFEDHVDNVFYNIKGAVSSGKGRNYGTNKQGFAYTGRAEILPFGKFEMEGDYFEGDWAHEKKPKLSLGATYSQNQHANRTGGQLGSDLFENRTMNTAFVDMMFKYNGWAMLAELMQRQSTNPITYNTDSSHTAYVYNGQGLNTQLSYQTRSHHEIAVRYCAVKPDKSIYSREALQQDFTLGYIKYIHFHRLKVVVDATYTTRKNMLTNANLAPFWVYRLQVELGI